MSRRRRWIVLVLLLIVALAGGLWWRATRLNATERMLVGVWETDTGIRGETRSANLLLSDKRLFMAVTSVTGDGQWFVFPAVSWSASESDLVFRSRLRPPRYTSLDAWWDDVLRFVRGGDVISRYRIQAATPDEVRTFWEQVRIDVTFKRSDDPELLRIFDRLSAGDAP